MLFLGFISGKIIRFQGNGPKPLKNPGSLTSTQFATAAMLDGCTAFAFLGGHLPGYLLVNLDFLRFWHISLEIRLFTRKETQEQHSLLNKIFGYIFILELKEHTQ